MLEPLPEHRVLSLMPTFRCTASCKSCGTLSSPRSPEALEESDLMNSISDAARLGFGLVVFTGGEATLAGDTLLRAISHARELGLTTRLVTNCHWAVSEEAADRTIGELQGSGLDEINYSTGDEHARFVPVLNVLRAIRAAVAVAYTPAVMIELVAARHITLETLEGHPHLAETRRLFPGSYVKITESPWMPLRPDRTARYPDGVAIDRSNLSSTSGCDSVLGTYTVQANGRIGSCCGLGMRLIPELQDSSIADGGLGSAIERSRSDFLKRWIRVEGPERILAWAAEKDPQIEWEGMYAHRCQACLRLYKDEAVGEVIRSHYREKVPDVFLGEWLLYRYDATESAEASP